MDGRADRPTGAGKSTDRVTRVFSSARRGNQDGARARTANRMHFPPRANLRLLVRADSSILVFGSSVGDWRNFALDLL